MGIHAQIIQLIVGYTLAGALVFTIIVTCLSLVEWIKFADQSQQNKLFVVLIVELVIVSVGFFAGLLKFDAASVERRIREVEQYKQLSTGLNGYIFATQILEEYLQKNLTTKEPMLASVWDYNNAVTYLKSNESANLQLLQIHPDKSKAEVFEQAMRVIDEIDRAVHQLNDQFEKVSVLQTQDRIDPKRAEETASNVQPLLAKLKSLAANLLAFNGPPI